MAERLPRFVVFGEALTDLVRVGPDCWRSIAGGACWNVARVASTLGLDTAWAGCVSADLFGQDILARSRQAGLDPRFLQVVDKPPLLAVVHQLDPPRYFFLGQDSADLAFDVSQLPPGWETACEYAHFGCISLVRPPLGPRLVDLAERLHAAGVRISFDPNCRNLMGPDYPALFERLAPLACVLKISEEDLAQLYPDRPAALALAHVRALAPAAVLLHTRGSLGMSVYSGGHCVEQPAMEVAVVDTVGAGDACVGGFIASRLLNPQASLADHVRFATATAAAACTQAGAHAPTPAEVSAILPASGR
jgi:fructokinase